MRGLKVVGVLLVLILGLLIGADRIAVSVAQGKLADGIAQQYSLDSKPLVSITGFPFLTQAISGDYSSIRIKAKDIPAGKAGLVDVNVTLQDLMLPLSDALSGNVSNAVSKHVVARVTLTSAQISKLVGQQVTVKRIDDSTAQLLTTVSALGITLPITADVKIKPADHALTLSVQSISAGSAEVPSSLKSTLAGALNVTFPLPSLAANLTPTKADVQDGEVTIVAEGDDVALRR